MEKTNFIDYLRSMLSDEQIDVLARNLGKSHISFYGPGLGKTKLVENLRNAWFKNVYAPEDCDSIRSGCMAVCNREGAIALCIKKNRSARLYRTILFPEMRLLQVSRPF